ncbi:MAG: rRNA methyltransferase, partial [Bacillota bacterium]
RLATPGRARLVFLGRPARLGNVGAVIRAAAAAGAAGVVTTGPHDPWHPSAVRGAAGLQYALPVARLEDDALPAGRAGPPLAVDPEGHPLAAGDIPAGAVLAFGSERRGLSPELLSRAHRRVAIPMTPGVSSLNLATAVAVVLYAWRLDAGHGGRS